MTDDPQLCQREDGLYLTNAEGELHITFTRGKNAYRRKHGGRQKQLIARAIGVKGINKPKVLDLTCGFADDAFALACLGCHVTGLERSAALFALLQDAHQRLQQHDAQLAAQLNFLHIDAHKFLANAPGPFDVIYMDPMYPTSKKSALNKKTMRLLRSLVGDDQDAAGLVPLAWPHARRIVVKRPRLAPPLSDARVDLNIVGKASRFDVYFPNKEKWQ